VIPKARDVAGADRAYQRLRNEIVSGQLQPNQRLIEADVSARLGVSRATVRALLSHLSHDGLVVREANRGAHVRFISIEEAIEITQARAALEALAAQQAADRATAQDIKELRALLTEMKSLRAQGDLLGYSDGNRRLHARILEISQHRTVQRLVGDLKAQLVRFQYRTVLVPGRSERSLAEHSELVRAIARHDAVGARTAMDRHLGGVVATLKQLANYSNDIDPVPGEAEVAQHG
jgi:DNA-binding GntR family transcriptional regulator